MKVQASQSEDSGIAALTENDLNVLSVGISTGGVAEIRMAELNPSRQIVATTIDNEGVEFARKYIAEKHLESRIEAKLEDVSEPLPYSDNQFDYVYARLVLHYLPEDKLKVALAELNRVIKPSGRIFIVVRSTDCPDAKYDDIKYDPITHLTTRTYFDDKSGKERTWSRLFHTTDSISGYVTAAGFEISHIKSYDERLYVDFMRTELSPKTDNVIELLAVKK